MKRRQPEAGPDIGSGRPLLDRLGVKPGMRVALIGFRDPAFEAELRERGAAPELGRPRPGLDMLFYMVEEPAGLLSLGELTGLIHDAGALWVLRVKGPGLKVREVDVIDAGKVSGLVDNKIASFSETYAAMRLVVPLARRGKRPRPQPKTDRT